MKKNLGLTAIFFGVLISNQGQAEIIQDYGHHVTFLASDATEGRETGTKGFEVAAKYVTEQLASFNFKPFFPNADNTFNHFVPIKTAIRADEFAFEVYLPSQKTVYLQNTDFIPASFSANGALSGEIIDVGFGIEATELAIDDFANKDLHNKIALIKRHVPPGKLTTAQEKYYGDFHTKISVARSKGAVGVLFWESFPEEEDILPKLSPGAAVSVSSIPIIFIGKKLANDLIININTPINIKTSVNLIPTIANSYNIVAVPNYPCDMSRPVFIGAHLDHLGYGGSSSLEPGVHKIHPGADDNASGVAALIEVARIFATPPANYKPSDACPVFAAFTAEEIGAIGSTKLVQDLNKLNIKPKAMLNFDMVGRMQQNTLNILSTITAPEWPEIITPECISSALTCKINGDLGGGSDHVSFIVSQIPSIFFFTGLHADYHKTTDTADKINFEGGASIAKLASTILAKALSAEQSLTFSMQDTNTGGGDTTNKRAYLGTVPDFGSDLPQGIKGVLLSGTMPGSPADLAGIKAGDIIIALDSLAVESLEDYAFALRKIKPNQTVVIKILRDGAYLYIPVIASTRK